MTSSNTTDTPERLALARDIRRQIDALAVMERNGFVIALDLGKPFDQLNEAERWQKLAFTFYTLLVESASRAEGVLTAEDAKPDRITLREDLPLRRSDGTLRLLPAGTVVIVDHLADEAER